MRRTISTGFSLFEKMAFIFRKPVDPTEQVNKWQKAIKKEIRQLEKDISKHEKAESKQIGEIKRLGARGDRRS